MGFDDIQVFSTLRGALGFHSERARTLAVNVANADTPGFVPRDIAGGDVGRALESAVRPSSSMQLATTHPLHFQIDGAPAAHFRAEASPDSETTLDGNAVVLEEQMARVAANRMEFDAAITLYEKSLNILRMAARAPNA